MPQQTLCGNSLNSTKKKHYKRTVGEISGRSPRSHHYRVYMQHVGPVFGFGRCSTEACPGKKKSVAFPAKTCSCKEQMPQKYKAIRKLSCFNNWSLISIRKHQKTKLGKKQNQKEEGEQFQADCSDSDALPAKTCCCKEKKCSKNIR